MYRLDVAGLADAYHASLDLHRFTAGVAFILKLYVRS